LEGTVAKAITTPAQRAAIRRRYEDGEDLNVLAKLYGISYNTAYKIVTYVPAGAAQAVAQAKTEAWRRDAAAEQVRYGRVMEPVLSDGEADPLASPRQTQAELMRESFEAGLSVKEVEAHFKVPYHTAYQAHRRFLAAQAKVREPRTGEDEAAELED
jgi:Mor family transcriptional regulator